MTATVRRWDAIGLAEVALCADGRRLRLELAATMEGGRWSLFMPISSVMPMFLRCAHLVRDAVRRELLTADQAGELTQGPRLLMADAAVHVDAAGRPVMVLRSPDGMQVAFDMTPTAAKSLAGMLLQSAGTDHTTQRFDVPPLRASRGG